MTDRIIAGSTISQWHDSARGMAVGGAVAARVLKSHGIARGLLLLNVPIVAQGDPQAADSLVDVIGRAFANQGDGRGKFALCGGAPLPYGTPVKGRVSGAYQVVELPANGFNRKRRQYAVQAIRFGKSFTVIALGSEPSAEFKAQLEREFAGQRALVTGCPNEEFPPECGEAERATIHRAVRTVVSRVAR